MIDAAEAADVTLRWTIAPKNFAGAVQTIEQRRALAQGRRESPVCSRCATRSRGGRTTSASRTATRLHSSCCMATRFPTSTPAPFGIRHFELRKWIAYLNGKRLFIKGNNYAPGDTRIATMTPERYAHDLQLAIDCHMNMLRIHAHVEHPAFYEAADLAGILLWQDFPLQWMYRREVLPEACRQCAPDGAPAR